MKWLACFWPSLAMFLISLMFAMLACVSLYSGRIAIRGGIVIEYSKHALQFSGFICLYIVCSLVLGFSVFASLQKSAAIYSAKKTIEKLRKDRERTTGK